MGPKSSSKEVNLKIQWVKFLGKNPWYSKARGKVTLLTPSVASSLREGILESYIRSFKKCDVDKKLGLSLILELAFEVKLDKSIFAKMAVFTKPS